MKRLLTGLVAAALLASPAIAQTTPSRAEVVAQCASNPAACAEVLAAYLATLPPAARLAAYEAITVQLSEAGVVATLPPPPPAPATAAPVAAPVAAPAANTGSSDSAPPSQASGT